MQVKVLRNQLWMLHGAFAAHSLSCQNFLEKNIQEAGEHLNNVSTDVPSFLEESWHSKATTKAESEGVRGTFGIHGFSVRKVWEYSARNV